LGTPATLGGEYIVGAKLDRSQIGRYLTGLLTMGSQFENLMLVVILKCEPGECRSA
jgi:hypothetical protein